jgi:hypothetical protein
VLEDVGPRTPEEEDLGFHFIDGTSVEKDWENAKFPNEDDVMRIAGKWSINSQEIDAYESDGDGFLGDQP